MAYLSTLEGTRGRGTLGEMDTKSISIRNGKAVYNTIYAELLERDTKAGKTSAADVARRIFETLKESYYRAPLAVGDVVLYVESLESPTTTGYKEITRQFKAWKARQAGSAAAAASASAASAAKIEGEAEAAAIEAERTRREQAAQAQAAASEAAHAYAQAVNESAILSEYAAAAMEAERQAESELSDSVNEARDLEEIAQATRENLESTIEAVQEGTATPEQVEQAAQVAAVAAQESAKKTLLNRWAPLTAAALLFIFLWKRR